MPVVRALASRAVRFSHECGLTDLVIADECTQRSHQTFIFDFLGNCLPSLLRDCSLLISQLCFVRTVGNDAAILQRYVGCHAGLQIRKAGMQRRRRTAR